MKPRKRPHWKRENRHRHVLANVQLLCRACNERKGSTPPEFWARYEEESAA